MDDRNRIAVGRIRPLALPRSAALEPHTGSMVYLLPGLVNHHGSRLPTVQSTVRVRILLELGCARAPVVSARERVALKIVSWYKCFIAAQPNSSNPHTFGVFPVFNQLDP